jgi:hypothetical protein
MRPIFFHNQSGEEVLRAMQAAASRREPTVVLSRALLVEIRMALGIAEPSEPTLVLLRREHRRKPRAARRSSRIARVASIVPLIVLATALAALLGWAIVGG